MALHITETERLEVADRIRLWKYLLVLAFGLLLARFVILQVVQYKVWKVIAETNQIRKITIPSMRGNIYDRERRLLADWEKSFNVTVVPSDLTDEAAVTLAGLLEITPEQMKERIDKNRSWSPFIPVLVAEDIPWETFVRVEENRVVLTGVDTEERPKRKYHPGSALVSHLLGYLGEINRQELNDERFRGYRMGDRIGRTGLEKSLETTLRGRDGVAYKLIDARGRELSLEESPEILRGKLDYRSKLDVLQSMSWPVDPGKSVVLTIDLQLQGKAREHMGSQRGSVVVMDVRTGELLVLLSNPGYDPSVFVGEVSARDWQALRDSPDHPLLNRAVMGAYPPGSIFKIIVAAAGLEEGIIFPNTRFTCTGSYELVDTVFGCWNVYGHGSIDLDAALVESCDVYFYHLGERLGVWRIAEWSRKFGLGRVAGIGLGEEKPGLIPDPDWWKQTRNRIWYPGETLLMAIGQGVMQITPLQAVFMPEAVANDGRIMQPQLVHHLEDVEGRPLTRFQPIIMHDRLLSPQTVKFLRTAMEKVVEDKKGTAFKYVKSDSIRIAGKTGTSEVSKRYKGKPIEEIPYKFRDHAWFVAYAPSEKPEIAMVVMVEHGGSGGATAGTIARKIIEDWATIRSMKQAAASIPPPPDAAIGQ